MVDYRKVVSQSKPGTDTVFGTDDVDIINLLLKGADQTADAPIPMNTQMTFGVDKLIGNNPKTELYQDLKGQASAPTNQPDPTYSRVYPKILDSNNIGYFYKTKIGGTITEVRLG